MTHTLKYTFLCDTYRLCHLLCNFFLRFRADYANVHAVEIHCVLAKTSDGKLLKNATPATKKHIGVSCTSYILSSIVCVAIHLCR